MRFALRDDDTNYFTTPEALSECYDGIWNYLPPSLCIISKVKGNWPKWLGHIYEHRQYSDWEAWEKDDKIYPIEENQSLILFLKEKLAKGEIDICFHAKHHRNEDAVLPQEIPGNYIQGAEYYTKRDLTSDIRNEIKHLNDLFNYRITVFTPPQNLLSHKGYKAVLKAGLNICGGGIAFYRKQKDFSGLMNIARQLSFKLKHREDDYPFVLNFRDHTEIPYHYSLQPNTLLDELIDAFDAVKKYNGDFVLSTHYAEFNYPMQYNHRLTMKNILEAFLDHISKYRIEYMTLSKLLSADKKDQHLNAYQPTQSHI